VLAWLSWGRGCACLSECLFWLAVGCRLLGVECWVLQRFAGCLVVWLAGKDREAARERGREGESASEQKERTGVRGAGEGGQAGQKSRATRSTVVEQSRPEQAGQRNGAHVVECPGLVWSCPLCWCVNKTVLYVVVICEQRSNSGRAFGSSPDGLAASSSRFSSRWPRRHFLLRPLSCGLAWGWTATPCLAPRESPQPTG